MGRDQFPRSGCIPKDCDDKKREICWKVEVGQLREASAELEAEVAESKRTVQPSIFKNGSEAFIVLVFGSMRRWVLVHGSDTLWEKRLETMHQHPPCHLWSTRRSY